MKKAIDFLNWEVLTARGGTTRLVVTGLIFLTFFLSLLVLAVAAVLSEEFFQRGFWFYLLVIVPAVFAAWFKLTAELVRLRYRWETGQETEED